MRDIIPFRRLVNLLLLGSIIFMMLILSSSSHLPTVAYAQAATIPQPLPTRVDDQWQAIWKSQADWNSLPRPAHQPLAATQRQINAAVQARSIWVDGNAASGGDGAETTPFNIIQLGIDAANAGDVVIVQPGIYTNSSVHMKDDVDVIGAIAGDPTQVKLQITSDYRVICANNALLQDISIKLTSANFGAFIVCNDVAPLFNRILIEQAEQGPVMQLSDMTGAVIANSQVGTINASGKLIFGGNLILGDLTIGNSTHASAIGSWLIDANLIAGALYVFQMDATGGRNQIINNWLRPQENEHLLNARIIVDGAAGGQLLIANNTILGFGTGIYLGSQSAVQIVNNIIAYTTDAGIQKLKGAQNPTLSKNLFWANALNVSGLSNPIGSNGNIQYNPRFANLNQGDFHLTSSSPGLDFGQVMPNITHDIDGDTRPCDGNSNGTYVIDIGADEYANGRCLKATPTPTPTARPLPTATPTTTPVRPTNTPVPPTLTATPMPTNSPLPPATPTSAPTVTPTVMPTATPGETNCQQLLLNPGFETRTGWVLPATAFSATYSTEHPLAGAADLRLGIPANSINRQSYSSGYQWLVLPTNAKKLTLQAQVWRASTVADSDFQYGWATVAGGTTYRIFQGLSNAQKWETITYDLTALRGKRVQFLFGVYNNGVGGKTVMYADEVTVQSCQ